MPHRNKLIAYIIFGLIAIGILSSFINRPSAMLIPIVVLGVVFYLYKFPPTRRSQKPRPGAGRGKQRNTKSPRKSTFRVIRGNKRDDDNEPPRFH